MEDARRGPQVPMTPERWRRVKELFAAVLERPAGERAGFLEAECRGDADLLSEVAALLLHHGALSTFLEPAPMEEETLPEGGWIGGYTILRVLGRGGMGVVYLAEQQNPRRTVALKVVHSFAPSPSAIRRFEHEAAILARLQHPGIAQIHEAGTAQTSRGAVPWFAMERIDGRPLGEYAELHRLGTRARLEVFVKTCDAVQHAHQRGVIHRDLKPANVLVDASGQPKVLDFGVARATNSDVQLTTLRTDVGILIGTLPYMSPEQVGGDPQALDTRSDVYALGVVLYELLTGRLPYELKERTVPDAVRIISEQEPSRLSSSNKVFRGDLETIVAKALEKDRDRRYGSARELAQDIGRFLADQPIAARPVSTAYQLRKFAKRNKALVGGVIAAFVALAAGVIGTTSQAVQAREERAVAKGESRKAQEILEFLEGMLESIDPDVAQGRDVTILRTMLDQAAARIESELVELPEVEAAVRFTIGRMYSSLGLYPQAEPHLRRAVELNRSLPGTAQADVASSLYWLASLLEQQGRFDEAETLCREALEIRCKVLGAEHAEVAENRNGLGEILDHRAARATSAEKRRGFQEAAVTMFRGALETFRACGSAEDKATAHSLNNLARALGELGDLAGSESMQREALELLRSSTGEESREVGVCLYDLGELVAHRGADAEAEPLFRESLRIGRKLLGDHPAVANVLHSLALILERRQDYAGAEELLNQAIQIQTTASGDPRSLATSLASLARVLLKEGRPDAAEPPCFEAIDLLRAELGDGHPELGSMQILQGQILLRLDRGEEAEHILREALESLKGYQDGRDRASATVLLELADALSAQDDETRAQALRLESLALFRSLFGDRDPQTIHALRAVIVGFEALKEPEKAAEYRALLLEPARTSPADGG